MEKKWPQPVAYVRSIFDDILQTEGSASLVAFSFALGTFLALLPTFGFAPFLGLLLVVLVPTLHKPGLLSAFVVWNPLVQIPIYSVSLAIGSLLFSGMPVVSFDIAFLDHVYNLTRRLLVGNFIVSSSLSVLSYIVVFVLIRRMKGRPIFMDEE